MGKGRIVAQTFQPVMLLVVGLLTLAMAGENWAQVYQTYENPMGSITYGPGGQVYMEQRNPMGSTTYGPGGRVYQTYDTPMGSTTYGPR